MIQLTRWRLRQICDVLRASVWDADRDPNLPVLVEAGPAGLTISARNVHAAELLAEAGETVEQLPQLRLRAAGE